MKGISYQQMLRQSCKNKLGLSCVKLGLYIYFSFSWKVSKYESSLPPPSDNSELFEFQKLLKNSNPPLGPNSEIIKIQNISMAADPLGQTSEKAYLHREGHIRCFSSSFIDRKSHILIRIGIFALKKGHIQFSILLSRIGSEPDL